MKTPKNYKLNASSRIRYQDLLENRQLVSFLVSVFLLTRFITFLVTEQLPGISELKQDALFFFSLH